MEDDWDLIRGNSVWPSLWGGSGALRIAVIFGCAAAVLALVATPYLDRGSSTDIAEEGAPVGLDDIATGSIKKGGGRIYTLHRSVLQASPDAVCVIRKGRRVGDC